MNKRRAQSKRTKRRRKINLKGGASASSVLATDHAEALHRESLEAVWDRFPDLKEKYNSLDEYLTAMGISGQSEQGRPQQLLEGQAVMKKKGVSQVLTKKTPKSPTIGRLRLYVTYDKQMKKYLQTLSKLIPVCRTIARKVFYKDTEIDDDKLEKSIASADYNNDKTLNAGELRNVLQKFSSLEGISKAYKKAMNKAVTKDYDTMFILL